MELSKRLHMVASMVEKGSIPADVGCDHGYVAVYLIREGVCPRVFAMDVNEGPLERAREHVEEFGGLAGKGGFEKERIFYYGREYDLGRGQILYRYKGC